jgi:hypothetical protein
VSKPWALLLCVTVLGMALLSLGAHDSAAAADPRSDSSRGAKDKPIYERAGRWVCDVDSKFLCFEDVCRRFSVVEENDDGTILLRYWMELDFEQHTYARCDQNGCNTEEVGTSSGEGFTLIEPGGGAFMKIANRSREFVDVATMGTGLASSFGTCRPAK